MARYLFLPLPGTVVMVTLAVPSGLMVPVPWAAVSNPARSPEGGGDDVAIHFLPVKALLGSETFVNIIIFLIEFQTFE